MKFFFVICAIFTIPLIEGFPNDYEQMLEPRGITDSFLSWFYDEPENENDIDEDTSGGYTWNTASQMTESFQSEDRNKVIPVGKVTPKTKVEPIEDLLKELNEEIKQSSDEVEKKTVFDTLTEIKGNLKNAPSRFVNVMVNNTRRLVDIGSFGSSRRTRSLQEVNGLAGLIEWILSFFNIFGNLTGNLSSSGAHDSQGILKTYFGNPVHEQSTSIIGFPNMKKSSALNLGDGFGNHDLNVFILNNKRANAEADNIFKGKTNDETMDNIEKVLRGKTNADAKTKWLILVELGNMYNDVLDDQTKKRIIHLILLICDDKEFDELFDIIKEMDDPACKRIFNLFITERENLKDKLKVIETSMSNDKDPVSKKMSNAEKKQPVSGDDNNSVEYYITEIDKNKGQKSEPRKVDEKEYRNMLSNASNMDSPTTHSDIKQPAPEIQRSTINPAHRNDDISPASPVGSSTPAQGEPVTKTKESHPPNKSGDPSYIHENDKRYDPKHDSSPKRDISKASDAPKNDNNESNIVSPPMGPVSGESNINENHGQGISSSPHYDPHKNIIDPDENFNNSLKLNAPEQSTILQKSHSLGKTDHEHHNPTLSPDNREDNTFSVHEPHPSENEGYDQSQPFTQENHSSGVENQGHPSTHNAPPTNTENENSPSTAHKLLSPPSYKSLATNIENPNHSSTNEHFSTEDQGNSSDSSDHLPSHDPPSNDTESNKCVFNYQPLLAHDHEPPPSNINESLTSDLGTNEQNEPSTYELFSPDDKDTQHPFIASDNEYDPNGQDDNLTLPHTVNAFEPENHDHNLANNFPLPDEDDPSNDSHQQPYLQTYYPYFLESSLTTMNYDPHEKTYIVVVENEHYGLDDVLGRINCLIEDKQDILREVERHIAEDLTSWIAFLGNNENEQSKVNDQTYRNIIKTIDDVGSSPKFHDFHNELKSTENLSPKDRGILECIFGDTPPVNQHENNHGHPPPTHFEEFTFIPHGDPNSNSFGYTQIKKSFSTQSHSDTFPSTPAQPSSSTNESLRRKITHYIDLQKGLGYREMKLPENVGIKMNLEEQIKDSKFNTLRNEFINKVTPQHLVSQLSSFQDYLKNRGINATNEEDEKKVIQGYIKNHYKA